MLGEVYLFGKEQNLHSDAHDASVDANADCVGGFCMAESLHSRNMEHKCKEWIR